MNNTSLQQLIDLLEQIKISEKHEVSLSVNIDNELIDITTGPLMALATGEPMPEYRQYKRTGQRTMTIQGTISWELEA